MDQVLRQSCLRSALSVAGSVNYTRQRQRERLCGQSPRSRQVYFVLQRKTSCSKAHQTAAQKASKYLADPLRECEVDADLWSVLDLCSDDELEGIHKILFGSSLLSPLVKTLVADNEPPAVQLRGRATLMHRIESRFRFLAADSAATLRGYRPSYREVLLHVRDRLQVPCPGGLATQDLESEIFLHMLHQQAEEMQGHADDLQAAEAASKSLKRAKQTGQESLSQRWAEMLASLRMGAPELLPTAVKLGSALSVQSLRRTTLRQLGQQLLAHRAHYQAALRVVCRGSAPAVQRQAALQAAQAGVTTAAARYGTVQGALAMLGPVTWAWLAADLALKSIGTDYGRIVKAIYALAQVRLLRTHGFVNPVA